MLRFLAVAVPGYKPLCRQTVSKNLQNRYKVIRKKIKEILERIKYVALTTDVWKSRTRMSSHSSILYLPYGSFFRQKLQIPFYCSR